MDAIPGHAAPGRDSWLAFAAQTSTEDLTVAARAIRDTAFGRRLTYSRKVFIPLTQLCRDVCHYCTFAKAPRDLGAPFMLLDEVLNIARAGKHAGCKEALFTLGEKPELRYRAASEWLSSQGYASTIDYLAAAAALVLKETGLLPHINAGTLSAGEIALLRPVSASMGLMLESSSERLTASGFPHHGSPDKTPQARLATLARFGELKIPTTSGILIGIGETEAERVASLLDLRDLHLRHGHIQEIIIQNFRAKPDTKMARHPEPPREELLRAIAHARILFGGEVSIQVPPNLNADAIEDIIDAGIDDWGGISPVTQDHVNPEAPWPHLDELASRLGKTGRELVQRLTVYPRFARRPNHWLASELAAPVLRLSDAEDLGRDCDWRAGLAASPPQTIVDLIMRRAETPSSVDLGKAVEKASRGECLGVSEIETLFTARGRDFSFICRMADDLRREAVGDAVSFVVTRNINYTNVCVYRCTFCAFSKGKTSDALRGTPYEATLPEIARRTREAWARGATEVCMQGGIHPGFTGNTYLSILRVAKAACPEMHIHAFSPLEVTHGAQTLGVSITDFLTALKEEGLGSLPGTAAEILDDEVRQIICPDKLSVAQWLTVIEAAHKVGLPTTATIMYGHVERPIHWARHLAHVRALQKRTGGITEFVPLPFVASEAPMFLKGQARPGPTFREAVLMHAVARIVLQSVLPNIQCSWVKLGPAGVQACLQAGANDLGGTLMNESITRAAGACHGQETDPQTMRRWIEQAGREARQRTTLFGAASPERQQAALGAAPLAPLVNAPFAKTKVRSARNFTARAKTIPSASP